MLDEENIKQRLKQAFWDYNYSAEDLYDVLCEQKKISFLDKNHIYQRLLETYSWYKLINILTFEQLQEALSETIIKKLRGKPLQNRYYHVSRILRKTVVSATE